MDRRDFLRNASVAAGLVGIATACGRSLAARVEGAPVRRARGGQNAASRPARETRSGDMLYRTLGRTGEKVSLLGLGGFHMGLSPDEDAAVRLIRTAIDRGVTFLDNSWDYHGGRAEQWMGKALRDGYRDKVFVMTKLDGRTKKSAGEQIDESLKRLGVDRIDLMQIHEVIRVEDADRCFEAEGAVAALTAARQAGKIRYVGFTGHKDPFIHNRMLDVAEQHGYTFDTVQMPLNVLDAHFRSFERQVLPRLVQSGIGVLGMKPLASGAVIESCKATATECLHYAMSLPTAVVITGMETPERLEQALEAVRTFRPLTQAETAALLERTEEAAATGKYEKFKTDVRFDATTRHPEWLG